MDFLLPVLIAIAAWWSSTVVLLFRAGMARSSYRRTLLGATVALGVGLYALAASRDDVSPFGAYLGFIGALAVFGWHEVSYLFGFVSGPRPEACSPDCRGWQRFVLGVKASAYHELAVVATVGIVAFAMQGADNRTGLWTLVVLWLMRWSAKLNIFLGVPNLHSEFWPDHLAYLVSFARERSMNGLFPLSVIAGTTAATLLIVAAVNGDPGSGERTAALLLATLTALATLEHWLLILPVSDERIWQPGLRARSPATAAAARGEAGNGSC